MAKVRSTIRVDVFDPKSIQAAADALQAKGKWINEKCEELSKRLADIGMREAIVSYQGAIADGNTDVSVRTYKKRNGYVIEAYGEDVFFVEFGTGVAAGNGYDTTEIKPKVSIEPGSYSQTIGAGMFTDTHPYWWYGGRRYIGTRPYMGMYHASKAIKQNFEKVVSEVFRS